MRRRNNEFMRLFLFQLNICDQYGTGGYFLHLRSPLSFDSYHFLYLYVELVEIVEEIRINLKWCNSLSLSLRTLFDIMCFTLKGIAMISHKGNAE